MNRLIRKISLFYNRPLTYLDIKIYLHAFYAASLTCQGLAFIGVLLTWVFRGYNEYILLAIVILAGSLIFTTYLSLVNRMQMDALISKAIESKQPLEKV